MARKQKTSPTEDLMNVIALLPWWAGVGLALVSYFVLHKFASQEAVMNTTTGQIVPSVTLVAGRAAANIGQYLLPFICLAGAGISAYRRRQRQTLVANVANDSAADALEGISWQEFEMLVGESFRLKGYEVRENATGGPDGGIDLVLRKGNEKFLVQCKQWKAFTVGVTIVRELYGVMAAEGAAGGFVVTSGKFTREATDFAKGRNVQLIDGTFLIGMIKSATAARGNRGKPLPEHQASTSATTTAPSCPLCAKTMVKRTAKKGANAGQVFWGCSCYPACKGIRQAA
ncbi:MAG: restriction endonuclease [Burkholderiaceae bacterium]